MQEITPVPDYPDYVKGIINCSKYAGYGRTSGIHHRWGGRGVGNRSRTDFYTTKGKLHGRA
ncbi:MAG: hypothetical protein LUK37_09605 [Clostridia bacterium]|nr:hypothetical protein [Clostridia bacterium]